MNPYNSDYGDIGIESMPPSPPHASGGFPPTNQGPPRPPAGPGGFTHHPNHATTNLDHQYPPYNPQDYVQLPPPPPGPPASGPNFPPPPGGPGPYTGPENVSQVPNIGVGLSYPDASRSATTEQGASP
jgi:hypothetical protein